jgi:hypothetical protein
VPLCKGGVTGVGVSALLLVVEEKTCAVLDEAGRVEDVLVLDLLLVTVAVGTGFEPGFVGIVCYIMTMRTQYLPYDMLCLLVPKIHTPQPLLERKLRVLSDNG